MAASKSTGWMDSDEPNPGTPMRMQPESIRVRRANRDDGLFKSDVEGVGGTLDLTSLTEPTIGKWLPPLRPLDYAQIARRLYSKDDSTQHIVDSSGRESVEGKDTRQPIIPELTDKFPYNAICKLLYETKSGAVGIGTGWFGGSNILYTAGHCVHSHKGGGKVSRIRIIPPGRNDTVIEASDWGCTDQYRHSELAKAYDMGCVLFKDPISITRGWLGFNHPYQSDDQLKDLKLNIFVYPDERNKRNLEIGAMYGDAGQVKDTFPRQLGYVVDTTSGQSGSPLMTDTGHVVGIHNYGFRDGSRYNMASRITTDVIELFREWKKKSRQQ